MKASRSEGTDPSAMMLKTGTPASVASLIARSVPSKIGTVTMPSYCCATALSMPAITASALRLSPRST